MADARLTDDELADALDGLSAYDGGVVSSGIRDETLRARCKAQMDAMRDTGDFDPFITRFLRDHFVSEAAQAQGYGPEDVLSFFRWLDERMGIAW